MFLPMFDESFLRALFESAKSRHHRYRVAADAVRGELRIHLRLLDEQSASAVEEFRATLETLDTADSGPRFVRFSHFFSTRQPCEIITACLTCETETLKACRDALNSGCLAGEARAMVRAHIEQISATRRLLQRLREELDLPEAMPCAALAHAVPA